VPVNVTTSPWRKVLMEVSEFPCQFSLVISSQ